MKILKKIGNKLFYRGGIFHPTKEFSLEWENDLKEAIEKGKKVINVGAGQHQRAGTISIDPVYAEEDEWHIKAFGENLPLEDNSIDFVICNGVLHYVKEPAKVVDEIYRVLKPGGRIYIEYPFLQPIHAVPNDYNRLALDGLKNLCKDFKEIDSGICMGPNSVLAWFLVEYAQIFFRNKLFKKVVKNITKIIVSPFKYFDWFLVKRKESDILAGGFYFYGEKQQKDSSYKNKESK